MILKYKIVLSVNVFDIDVPNATFEVDLDLTVNNATVTQMILV